MNTHKTLAHTCVAYIVTKEVDSNTFPRVNAAGHPAVHMHGGVYVITPMFLYSDFRKLHRNRSKETML